MSKTSFTRAAIATISVTTGKPEKEVVEGFGKYLAHKFFTVTLNQPKSVTAKHSLSGSYSKHPHIGGEKYTLEDAYLGKRGEVILIASVEGDTWKKCEFTAPEAEECLDGYTSAIESYVNGFGLDGDEERQMHEAKLESERKEREAHEAALLETRMQQDERFGSW